MTRSLAVVVHDLQQARAALALEATHGLDITLVSAPDAARYAGVGFLHAMERQLGRPILADCGSDAGLVMAGLRAGLRQLVFVGNAAMLARLGEIAGQLGGRVGERPELLSLSLLSGENPARAVEAMQDPSRT